jgi:hypothetical protein
MGASLLLRRDPVIMLQPTILLKYPPHSEYNHGGIGRLFRNSRKKMVCIAQIFGREKVMEYALSVYFATVCEPVFVFVLIRSTIWADMTTPGKIPNDKPGR